MKNLLQKGTCWVPFLLVGSALAAPAKTIEGIYSASTTTSMMPPRTTMVLIEPNGRMWGGAYNYGAALMVTGQIDQRTGLGVTTEVPDDELDIAVVPTATTATFTFSKEGNKVLDFRYHSPPHEKISAFDVPLLLHPNFNTHWNVPQNNYAGTKGTFPDGSNFTFNVAGNNKVSGSDGNCVYDGKLINTAFQYKHVMITFKANCYQTANKPIFKGTRYSGVLFPVVHEGFHWNGFMIFLNGKNGTKSYYIDKPT